jgi:hypothetical protein
MASGTEPSVKTRLSPAAGRGCRQDPRTVDVIKRNIEQKICDAHNQLVGAITDLSEIHVHLLSRQHVVVHHNRMACRTRLPLIVQLTTPRSCEAHQAAKTTPPRAGT